MEYDWVGFGYAALVASGGIIGYARAGRLLLAVGERREGRSAGFCPLKGLPACAGTEGCEASY